MSVVFKEKPNVLQPEDSAVLWRYMSLSKLQSLVDTHSLYFCRIDRFDDGFEGALPSPVADNQAEMIRQMNVPDLLGRVPESSYFQGQLHARERYRKFFYANCWHVNNHESTAMWNVYLGSEEGLAIKSTFSQMRKAVTVPKKGRMLGGLVSYVDYDKEWFDALGPVDTYFHKRVEYKHEHEYRLLYQEIPDSAYSEKALHVLNIATRMHGASVKVDPRDMDLNVETSPGVFLGVHLKELISTIVLCPGASSALRRETRNLLQAAALNANVLRSSLDGSPRFV